MSLKGFQAWTDGRDFGLYTLMGEPKGVIRVYSSTWSKAEVTAKVVAMWMQELDEQDDNLLN